MKSYAASVHCSSDGAVTEMLRHPHSKTRGAFSSPFEHQYANNPSREKQRRPYSYYTIPQKRRLSLGAINCRKLSTAGGSEEQWLRK
jgi:hypothetical protein